MPRGARLPEMGTWQHSGPFAFGSQAPASYPRHLCCTHATLRRASEVCCPAGMLPAQRRSSMRIDACRGGTTSRAMSAATSPHLRSGRRTSACTARSCCPGRPWQRSRCLGCPAAAAQQGGGARQGPWQPVIAAECCRQTHLHVQQDSTAAKSSHGTLLLGHPAQQHRQQCCSCSAPAPQPWGTPTAPASARCRCRCRC